MRCLVASTLTLLVVACNDVPDHIIQPEQMAGLLADMHKAECVVEANSGTFPTDSTKRALRQSVFARHGFTSEQVDSSMKWYGYHMEKYVEVYDRTLEILNDELAKAEQVAGSSLAGTSAGSMAMEGDSVDVWMGVRTRRFAPNQPGDVITFSLSGDPNWENGDVYRMKAKLLSNHHNARFTMAVNYTDGTIDYMSTPFVGDGWHEMRFALDSAKVARGISGVLHYPVGKGDIAFIDSISLTRTRWNPTARQARESVQTLGKKPQKRY